MKGTEGAKEKEGMEAKEGMTINEEKELLSEEPRGERWRLGDLGHEALNLLDGDLGAEGGRLATDRGGRDCGAREVR